MDGVGPASLMLFDALVLDAMALRACQRMQASPPVPVGQEAYFCAHGRRSQTLLQLEPRSPSDEAALAAKGGGQAGS